MRPILLAAAYLGLGIVAAQPGLLFFRTGNVTSVNLERCGYHPFIDYGFSLETLVPTTRVSSAAMFFASGALPTDTIRIDPDPYRSPFLTFDVTTQPCGPEFTLLVGAAPFTPVVITSNLPGGSSVGAVSACLRRAYWASTAFGGSEGVGTRTVQYSVTLASPVVGTFVSEIPNFVVVVDPPSDIACSAFTSARVALTIPPANLTYYTGCPGPACRGEITPLFTDATVSIPEPWASSGDPWAGLVQSVEVTFRPFSRVPLPPIDPANDRLWVLPAPGASCGVPCPGLTVFPTTSRSAPDVGVVTGLTMWGAATPDVFTSCLRRVYYFNAAYAAGGAPVILGPRPIGVTVTSPIRSGISNSAGLSFVDRLTLSGTCPPPTSGLIGGCPFPTTTCLGPQFILPVGPITLPATLPA